MLRINVYALKTHLSRILRRVARGETVVVCVRNEPVAELRPLPRRPAARRPLGLARKTFRVPKAFFDPLPADVLDAFEGRSS